MEYLSGETLQDYVYRCDPSLDLASILFPQICDAVSELHEAFDPPLIHRDLKPSNVMIADNQVYLIDFGIARELREQAETDTVHFGTRAYAPPEQYGYGQTTARSDVYALGMLLYFCLVEETPNASVVESGFADERIPPALRSVLSKATAFDPANRYSSARELKAAAETALQEQGDGGTQPASSYVALSQQETTPVVNIAQTNVLVTGPAQVVAPAQTALTRAAFLPENPATTPVRPTYFDPTPGASSGSKASHILGIAWNALLLFFCVVTVATSWSMVGERSAVMADLPAWFEAVWNILFGPLFIVGLTVALLDKRRLRAKFPDTIGKTKWWHGWLAALACFVLLFVYAGIGIIFFR